MTTNTHSGLHTLRVSSTLHTGQNTYKGEFVTQKLLASPAACIPVGRDPWTNGVEACHPGIGSHWSTFPIPNKNSRITLLQSTLDAKMGADGHALCPAPGLGSAERESSAWSVRLQDQVLRSRQGSVVLHIGGGMLGRTKLS